MNAPTFGEPRFVSAKMAGKTRRLAATGQPETL